MRRLARVRRARLGFGHLDAQAAEIAFHVGDPRRCDRVALAGIGQAGAGRLDRFRKLAVLPREQHLFPAPELVAQLLVTARPGRLALQRAALLFDLEHDVVHAQEVLPRRIEFQFRGPPARLVLCDTGSLLDQLASIGWTRAEDHSDLPLLDDRVGLRAQPGVHQQIVHIAQPARLAVDQVLALAGTEKPPRDFNFACDRLNQFRDLDMSVTVSVAIAVPVAIAVCLVMMAVAVPVDFVTSVSRVARKCRPADGFQDPGKPQAHFGGRRGLPGIAAAEDDVLHPLAAKAPGALLAHDPRDGVRHVALAASVGADNRGHAFVEGELGPVGERFEAVNLKTFEAHEYTTRRIWSLRHLVIWSLIDPN